MSGVNTRETIIGISRTKQQGIGVPVDTNSEFWRVSKTNATLASVTIATETDAQDIGKGDAWPRNQFILQKDANFPIESYLTSQKLAHFCCFGLGKVTKTSPETGAYLYTCVPANPAVDGIEAPLITAVEQIRPGGSAVVNRAILDCAINDFGFRMSSNVGRQNATLTANLVGSGRTTPASGITLPAALAETGLNAGNFSITVNGVDYISQKTFIGCEFNFNNNIDAESGFFPGSGTDGGAQVRGRQERGDPAITFRFQARFNEDSTELDDFLAQTAGTTVLGWQGPLIAGSTYHGGTITGHETRLKSATIQDGSGKVIVDCEVEFFYHATNGILTAAIVTNQDNIMATAA